MSKVARNIALRVFERKVVRTIFVRVWSDPNSELYLPFNGIYIEQRINIQLLRCIGHGVRMEEDALAKMVVDARICGSLQSE